MKVAIVAITLFAVVKANVIQQAPVAVAAPARLIETGSSRVARTEDNLGNYAFGYDEIHTTGGSFRREQATENGVTGSYGIRDADGRVRTVNYIADAHGFRASVSSNEPGVESKDSAGVLVNNGEIPPGPVPNDEPVVVAQTVAAPAPVIAAAPAQIVQQAPAQLIQHAPAQIVQHAAPLAAPAFAAPLAAAPLAAPLAHAQFAAPLAAPAAVAPLPAPVNGPLITRSAVPSAPVLATPTGHGLPTVLSNPLFSQQLFARPAISTPSALATGPLASPLSFHQPAPLAAAQLAAPAHAHLAQPLIQQAPLLAPAHGHLAQPLIQQAPIAQQLLAAPAPIAAHVQAPLGLGYQYQTQIQHLAAPLAAPAIAVAGVKGH